MTAQTGGMTDLIETAQQLERAMHADLMAGKEQQARRRAAARQQAAAERSQRAWNKREAIKARIDELAEQLNAADDTCSAAESAYREAREASTAATGASLHSDAYAQWRMADRHLIALRQQAN